MEGQDGVKAKRQRPRWHLYIFSIIGLITLAFIGCLLMLQVNQQQLEQTRVLTKEFVVPKGGGRNSILQALEQEQLIECAKCLAIHTRLFALAKPLTGAQAWEGSIKAGTYSFNGEYSAIQVLEKLIDGKVVEFQVTLIEGKTVDDWLQTLWKHSRIVQTIKGQTREERYKSIQEALKISVYPEGLFLPDTYSFAAKTTDVDILRRAYGLQKSYLERAWSKRQEDLPLTTKYEALTLASIVEKETGDPAERPIIAGVFMNRLRQKMRLETDPTVIYGIKDYDGNITRAHLREHTAYNTYKIPGLPPTPIAAASRAAIDAVMSPQETPAIFFVARGDGTHVFSETLQQHTKAVREYQLKRRKDYRSSPKAVAPAQGGVE